VSVVSSSAAQAASGASVSASLPVARRGPTFSHLPPCGAAPPPRSGRKGTGWPHTPPPSWTTTAAGSPSTLAPTPCAPYWSLAASAGPPRHACRVVVCAVPPPYAVWTGRRSAARSSATAARELEGTCLDRGRDAATSGAREEIWREESAGLRGGRPSQRSRAGGGEWRVRSRVCSLSSLLERCKNDVLYFFRRKNDSNELLELLSTSDCDKKVKFGETAKSISFLFRGC
jgi:hypothetical protein